MKLEGLFRWVTAILITGAAWPDAVVAPTYLAWISIGALLHERAVRGVAGSEDGAARHLAGRTG
jgi:hypothetical protein